MHHQMIMGSSVAPGPRRQGSAWLPYDLPGSGRKAADIYTELQAAEPHATAERKRELLLEATRQARQSPLFFDLTLPLSAGR
jgi:hypothetical protein